MSAASRERERLRAIELLRLKYADLPEPDDIGLYPAAHLWPEDEAALTTFIQHRREYPALYRDCYRVDVVGDGPEAHKELFCDRRRMSPADFRAGMIMAAMQGLAAGIGGRR